MSSKHPKVAVVLGQGGIKPAAALPVFELLDEMDIPCDLIVGCSGGSLVGGLKAFGKTNEEIMDVIHQVTQSKYMQKTNTRQLLALLNVPFFNYDKTEGVIIPTLMLKDLEKVFGTTTFEQLPTKLIVSGTDFQTGENIKIDSGFVKDALYASSCIYPFMPPVAIGDKLVVDGALSVPIPFEQAAVENPDLIIVITFTFYPDYCPEGFFSACDNFFSQAIDRKGRVLLNESIKRFPGKVVHIDVRLDEQISVLETDRLDDILEIGKSIATKYKQTIEDAYSEVSKNL